MFFLCMAGTDMIGDNRLKIIHGRRKTEKNFRLGMLMSIKRINNFPFNSVASTETSTETSSAKLWRWCISAANKCRKCHQ